MIKVEIISSRSELSTQKKLQELYDKYDIINTQFAIAFSKSPYADAVVYSVLVTYKELKNNGTECK